MRTPSWRTLLALVFVVGLAAATAYVVLRDEPPAPLPLAAEDASRAAADASAPPAPPDAAVLDAARRALDAWGRFGVSGDLREVTPYFHEAGPQYRKFDSESAALRKDPPGPPAYRFSLADPVIRVTGAERVVGGRVIVTRAGEDPQSFNWEIVLRAKREETWMVWTVRDR